MDYLSSSCRANPYCHYAVTTVLHVLLNFSICLVGDNLQPTSGNHEACLIQIQQKVVLYVLNLSIISIQSLDLFPGNLPHVGVL